MSEKAIYIGNGKKQNETWMKSSLCLSDIPKEHLRWIISELERGFIQIANVE